MTLTTTQALVIAGAVTLGTIITRFLPFLLFPDNKPIPKVVPAGADRAGGGDGAAPVEAQCAAVHRRRHSGVHAAGAAGIRVSLAKRVSVLGPLCEGAGERKRDWGREFEVVRYSTRWMLRRHSRRDRRLKTCHRHVFLTPRLPPALRATFLSEGGKGTADRCRGGRLCPPANMLRAFSNAALFKNFLEKIAKRSCQMNRTVLYCLQFQ